MATLAGRPHFFGGGGVDFSLSCWPSSEDTAGPRGGRPRLRGTEGSASGAASGEGGRATGGSTLRRGFRAMGLGCENWQQGVGVKFEKGWLKKKKEKQKWRDIFVESQFAVGSAPLLRLSQSHRTSVIPDPALIAGHSNGL